MVSVSSREGGPRNSAKVQAPGSTNSVHAKEVGHVSFDDPVNEQQDDTTADDFEYVTETESQSRPKPSLNPLARLRPLLTKTSSSSSVASRKLKRRPKPVRKEPSNDSAFTGASIIRRPEDAFPVKPNTVADGTRPKDSIGSALLDDDDPFRG